jgi:hypothetical protein
VILKLTPCEFIAGGFLLPKKKVKQIVIALAFYLKIEYFSEMKVKFRGRDKLKRFQNCVFENSHSRE